MATQFTPSQIATLPELLQLARAKAIEWHGSQVYDDQPYVAHLDDVVRVLLGCGAPLPVCIAGYYHDVLEDTDVTFNQLRARVGLPIAALVWSVTVDPGDRSTKAERYALCYRKLASMGPYAGLLKVADRIANVSASLVMHVDKPDRAKRYLDWYVDDQTRLAEAIERLKGDSIRLAAMWQVLTVMMDAAKDPETWYRRHLERKFLAPDAGAVVTSERPPAGNGAPV